ncbi:MAG: DNA topoisomerase, partial [Vibrio sp.]
AEGKLVFDIAGGCFIAKGRQLVKTGWRALLPVNRQQGEDASGFDQVPPLKKGAVLTCREGEVKASKTEPPRYFTEASLLQAMTGIARFVHDKSLKKILRDTDGLGTEATRAGILDTLFKRQLLVKEGKQIRSSLAGRGLIHALPESASFPDMTAHWEHQLQAMTEKKQAYQPFMQSLEAQVSQIIHQIKHDGVPASLQGLPAVSRPKFTKKSAKRRFKKKS